MKHDLLHAGCSMRIEDESIEGYRIRGMQRKGDNWRIKVWPEDKESYVHDYWVSKGRLHAVLASDLWHPGAALNSHVETAEHRAVLLAVGLWDLK